VNQLLLKKIQFSDRKITFFLFIFYLIFISSLAKKYGLIDQLEALKYTLSAKRLIAGDYSVLDSDMTPFLSYIFFLIPFTLAGNVKYAIAAQVLLSFSAAICLKKICEKWFADRRIGFIVQCIFLFNFFIQFWTISLYVESFFLSISTLFIYAVFTRQRSTFNTLVILGLALMVTFSRPQGILFVIPSLLYYLETHFYLKRKWSHLLLFILTFLVFTYSFNREVNCEFVYLPIADWSIICGFPQKTYQGFYPEKCTIAAAHQYLIHTYGPLQEFYLFIKKTISLFTFTRPYYSLGHNILVGLNYLLLICCLTPIFKRPSGFSKEVLFLYRIILLNICLIGLTYDDWHGRYLSIIMSVLILLSAFGLLQLKIRLEKTVNI
jgi:hypothetical protein